MGLKNLSKIQICSIILISLFTALSACNCMEHCYVYFGQSDLLVNDPVSIDRTANGFWIMVVLAVCEIWLIFKSKGQRQKLLLVLSMLRVVMTLRAPMIKLLEENIYYIMGGLGKHTYEIMPIWYIVFMLAICIFILEILQQRSRT